MMVGNTEVRPDSSIISAIRADFPILESQMHDKPLVFLDNAASSQKPRQVIQALESYYENQHANVHRGVYALSASATDAFERARSSVQRFINAASDHEVIFTKGTTEGINLVATCFERGVLQPGDEVLISGMEHHSNIVPWQIACEQSGASLKVIPVNARGELILEDLDRLISERTQLIALVHISNTLGTINPVEKVIAAAHAHDIPVLLDGAQAAPHERIDVQALDVDFYAFSAHKMYGPTGMGILYGKESWLDRLPPYQGGGEMIRTVSFDKTEYNDLPFKFEAGTPNIAGAIALNATIEYLEKLPWTEIQNHEKTLLDTASDELRKLKGLQIIGQAENKVSVVSFHIEGVHPHDIGTLLDQQGIAVRTGHHCTEPLMHQFGIPGTVRASFGIYNTLDEVSQLIEGVKLSIKMLR